MGIKVKHTTQATGTYPIEGELGVKEWNEYHEIAAEGEYIAAGDISYNSADTAALHRSPNAIASMFIYDTSKDSDGGAWTEKCQNTSWYNEPLSGKWLGAQVNELSARSEGAMLGNELITNGTFDEGIDPWYAGEGIAATWNEYDKSMHVSISTQYTATRMQLSIPEIIPGKLYKGNIRVTHNITGTGILRVYSKGAPASWGGTLVTALEVMNLSGAGTFEYEFSFVAPAEVIGATQHIQVYLSTNVSSTLIADVDNITIREVIATTTKSNDYFQLTTDGKFYKLWKNRLSQSGQLQNTWTAESGTLFTGNTAVAPDGTTTATKLYEDTSTGYHRGRYFSLTSGIQGSVTWSIYIKAAERRYLYIGDTYLGVYAYFDAVTGVIRNTINGVFTVTDASNGWWRISASINTSYPYTNFGVHLNRTDTFQSGVADSYTGDGTSGIYIWGAQLESGPVATTYEPKGVEGSISEVYRGNKKEFPKLIAIVAETYNLNIYDLTEPGTPMWMRFNVATSWSQMIAFGDSGSLASIAALNNVITIGTVSYGNNLTVNGTYCINFLRDSCIKYSATGGRLYPDNLANRNRTVASYLTTPATLPAILGTRFESVAMKVLPGAPIDQATGLEIPTIITCNSVAGISIIKHDGTVSSNGSSLAYSIAVRFNKRNDVVFVRGADRRFMIWRYSRWMSGSTFTNESSNSSAYTLGTQKIVTTDKAALSASNVGTAHIFIDDATNLGTFSSDVELKRVIRSAISNVYNTGHQPGDIRRTYLSDNLAETVVGPELISNGGFDTIDGWTTGNGWSIAQGQATFTGGTTGAVVQTINIVPGKVYQVEFDFKGPTTSGSQYFIYLGSTAQIAAIYNPSIGKKKHIGVAGTGGILQIYNNSPSGAVHIFDNVSVKEVVADRSYKLQGANIYGTLTKAPVATNAQLVSYSGFSNTNYLQEPYSTDLDFGTGEWSVSGWVNVPTTLTTAYQADFPLGAELVSNGGPNFTTTTDWVVQTVNTVLSVSNNRLVATGSTGSWWWIYYPVIFTSSSAYIDISLLTNSSITQYIDVFLLDSNKNSVSSAGNIKGYTGAGTYSFSGYLSSNIGNGFVGIRMQASTDIPEIISLSCKSASDVRIFSREYPSLASINTSLGITGLLSTTASDGTTTRTVTSTSTYNTGAWTKAEACYTPNGTLILRVNGSQVAATYGTPLKTLTSRYNLINYSEALENSYWTKNNCTVADATTLAPDPDSIAKLVTATANASSLATTAVSLVSGLTYTFSAWIQRVSGTGTVTFRYGPNGDSPDLGVTVGWQRFWWTFVASGTSTDIKFIQLQNLGDSVNVWGLQVEQADPMSFYQRTTTVAETEVAPLTIGNSYDLNAPFPGSMALVKLSATVPTTEQSQWMYEQEKHLFREGAQCCLPDSNSLLDLAYDDATDTWTTVSSANESTWSGLVRTSSKPVPAGSYSKVHTNSGIKLSARTTANPGVDITDLVANSIVKESNSGDAEEGTISSFDYVGGFTGTTVIGSTSITSVAGISYPTSYVGSVITGTGIPTGTYIVSVSGTTMHISAAATAAGTGVQISFTDFNLPSGHEATAVRVAGTLKREGSTQDYTKLYDGFKETVRFTTAPGYTAWVNIQTRRSK